MVHKLLLADDSITIQKVVELILADEGFEIKATNSGEEALAAVPSFEPDIILADIDMPKLNGYQLCEKIKQDPVMSSIPVILLTGAFEPIDEALVKHVKADDFIVKPFESQELISKINAALTVKAVYEEELEEVTAVEAVGLEESTAEEDLWALEEIPETADIESWPAEQGIGASTEEMIGIEEKIEPSVIEKPESKKVEVEIKDIELPSKDEIREIFENKVKENLSSLLSSLDIKESIIASLMPLLKDSVEKVLWEVTPDLAERMLKEMLQGSLESLTKEVEKVIWETVPDLAENMILKEIERIRSEF
ncbi:MAG: response regulator [Nitrospirae bacterium]|nr:response regulator [Nitrospirota bacterium]